GHVLGLSGSLSGSPVPVVWFLDDPSSPNSAPVIETISSPVAVAGERFLLEPEVSDAEGDPWTLTWSGDIPDDAIINGVFDWTPTPADVGASHTITVTATQDDDPTLSDSETFVLSVVAGSTPQADLSVTFAPVSAGR